MDDRLKQFYEDELYHIRHTAAEFAQEFPKIAARLNLTGGADIWPDPWVERLLEGFAFLAARVQLKFDAQFPRFTQSLLDTVYPHYLAPTPSMTLVQFQPDLDEKALADGFDIPRDSILRGKGEQTKPEFRTAHAVTLWPLRIAEASYHTRDLSSLEIPPGLDAKAGLRLRLESTAGLSFNEIQLEDLVVHFRGAGETAMGLYEQCLTHGCGIAVQSITRPVKWQSIVDPANVRRVGYDKDEALLPYDARSFQGYRLLREYFALPQRFLFARLAGIGEALRRCQARQIDLIILFREVNLALEERVDTSNVALFVTPAINLFPMRCDPISLSERFSEHHVVPDRTRPEHFEVYRMTRVVGCGTSAGDREEFLPFYSATDLDAERGGSGAYFVVKRVPRTLSSREKRVGRRTAYAGSEVYLSLVDADSAPYRSDLRHLSVNALCTNRDLAILLPPPGHGATDFTMDLSTSAPVEAVRCIGGRPTAPAPSHAEGEFLWRAISHLSLNYLSLADTDEKEGAAALRDIMRLYAEAADLQTRKQIDGLRSVHTRPVTRPLPTPGPITFARGLEVTLTFDEVAFVGTGVFLLGAVLAEFFTKYVSLNSFTETVVKTFQRPEIKRWRAKIGQRHML